MQVSQGSEGSDEKNTFVQDSSMGPVFRTVTVQTGAGIHVERDVVAVPPPISLFSSREKDRVFQVGMQEHTK